MTSTAAVQAPCTSWVGPGTPPPSSVASGIPGFQAHRYGQSGYPALCAGERSTATVAFYNSGSLGWVRGRMGEMAFLGTWNPFPGQDQPSALGGDGTAGSPSTGWPRFNRIAAQPADYVGPARSPGLTITSGDFPDCAGNTCDVPGSSDLVLGAPD